MKKELCDEFIAFAKAEYGLTVEAVRSDSPDSFEKIFGDNISTKEMKVITIPEDYGYTPYTQNRPVQGRKRSI